MFAHAVTTKLSWHVQNFKMMTSLQFGWEQNDKMKFLSNSNCNRKLSMKCASVSLDGRDCAGPLVGQWYQGRAAGVHQSVCLESLLVMCRCNLLSASVNVNAIFDFGTIIHLWPHFVVGLGYGWTPVPSHCQISDEFGSWMLHWPICFSAYASRVLGYLTYQITNPTMHLSFIPQCVTLRQIHAHFCSRLMHYGVWNRCIVGFER